MRDRGEGLCHQWRLATRRKRHCAPSHRGRGAGEWANRAAPCGQGRIDCPIRYFFRESVEAGGLSAYGVDLIDLAKRSAGYVDRILRGAKPGELPVEPPNKFSLAVNLKPAKALGLTKRMQALGWTEGRNIEYLELSAEGYVERLDALAREMVERKVDVIVAGPPPTSKTRWRCCN